jgi:hypothetical protein
MLMAVRPRIIGKNGRDGPKDITPMAWKTPLLRVKRGVLKVPFSDLGTRKPCVTTAIKITIMLIKANVLALANFIHQHDTIF